MTSRRSFVRGAASLAGLGLTGALSPAIERALAIPARRQKGTIEDVAHVVILMQENRSFDHYFGTYRGVRGFGDRFPIPVADGEGITRKNVWHQRSGERVLAPFPLATEDTFAHMRVTGTPHTWPNATRAWGDGKLHEWPVHKQDHSLGYFAADDLPFQFALAEAFTLCDAYHCAFHGGTNPNRCFAWTGTNDPEARAGGPVLSNEYDSLTHDPEGGYAWLTYSERLQQAGVSWQVYQDMADNFTDNPLAGFRSYRDAYHGLPGSIAALKARALTTRALDLLASDVRQNRLPQVSWIVATAEGSEHPGPSSPAQGGDYTARVLEALTGNPDVWSRTVLFVNFDENDGFFDHVPPPCAPSVVRWHADPKRRVLAGASSVDTRGEYHEHLRDDADEDARSLLHRPYGPGPRVPMYVVSPWSKGGWVNSEVFDHTSVLRFLERRFGVVEPNITPFRRAMCGDMTSCFDFRDPDERPFLADLPDTEDRAARARELPDTTTPAAPIPLSLPAQELGTRPSRALPYALNVEARVDARARALSLDFVNTGRAGAVLHVYDRHALTRAPRRYAVAAQRSLAEQLSLDTPRGRYDLWLLGPNGFHRHLAGSLEHDHGAEVRVREERLFGAVVFECEADRPCTFEITENGYAAMLGIEPKHLLQVSARRGATARFVLRRSGYWYDFSVRVKEQPGFLRRFAGRVETGRDSISDPLLGGVARAEQAPYES